MHSLVSLVGATFIVKENWEKWHRKITNTFVFKDFYDGVCDGNNSPTKPTNVKELAIWNVKNKKAYALISSSVSEEISHHIKFVVGDALKNLKKLTDLYDTNSQLEFIQLQLKLFNLELKDVLGAFSFLPC